MSNTQAKESICIQMNLYEQATFTSKRLCILIMLSLTGQGSGGFNEQNKLRSKEPEAWKHGTD